MPSSNVPVRKFHSAVWKEFKLPYDFGEPRCAHAASLTDFEDLQLMVVGGLTQPFYETTMKLKVRCAFSLEDVQNDAYCAVYLALF